MTLELSARALEQLHRLHGTQLRQVVECLDELEAVPCPAAARRLSTAPDIYSLPVGEVRLLYRVGTGHTLVLGVVAVDREELLRRLRAGLLTV